MALKAQPLVNPLTTVVGAGRVEWTTNIQYRGAPVQALRAPHPDQQPTSPVPRSMAIADRIRTLDALVHHVGKDRDAASKCRLIKIRVWQ
jgi:hypothetical protein